jgi:RNA polymerase sigma-70 factor (ECF subfamily)
LFESLEGERQPDKEFMPRDFADWREDPMETMERTEVREAVSKALEDLPDTYRQIFMLRDVQELSVSECAKILGIRTGAVKVRLHRARLMVREKLAPTFKAATRALSGNQNGTHVSPLRRLV